MIAILSAIALGVVLGLGASHALFLGLWTLLPWGLGGLALGYAMPRRPAIEGAIFGFVLCFTFMMAGYTGKASLLSRVPFFALIGVVGAVCGMILSASGAWLKRTVARAHGSSAGAA
jgi:hypothetical protein